MEYLKTTFSGKVGRTKVQVKKVQAPKMTMKQIAEKYERARAHAHSQFYYSTRCVWAREELDQALECIDAWESYELRQCKSQSEAIKSRQRELSR